jgi:superfamily II DNA/RNA helicase
VIGRSVPPPVEDFKKMQEEFHLAPTLIQNLQNSGYIDPTPIQMQAIPIMLQVWIYLKDTFNVRVKMKTQTFFFCADNVDT